MAQQQRPFVADPNEWEVIDGDEYEVVSDDTPPARPTWADRLGLNEPTASPMVGFLRGAGTGIVDLAQGAVSNITGQLNAKTRAENASIGALGPSPTGITIPPKRTLPDVARPDTFSGGVGSVLPVIGEMALPGGAPKAVSVAKNALPSVTRAGANFEKVMGAAKDIPVNVEPLGKVALRVMDLAERGSTMPTAVRKLLLRVTDPKKATMTYQESRDFASNISRLSVDEMNRLTPVVKRQVAELAAELNKANAEAAKAAGRGAEYKAAMREYANAMRMKDAIDAALKHSKKAALGAAGLSGAAYLLKD